MTSKEVGSAPDNGDDLSRKSHHASRSSLVSIVKDGVDNLEDSVTKKWLSWMLKRHIQTKWGVASADDADNAVDSALKFARDVIISEDLDPMTIRDDVCTYQKKMLFITLTVSVQFSSTRLVGASSLNRDGCALLQLQQEWITVETILITDNLQIVSHCHAHLLDIGPSFDLTSQVKPVRVRLKIRVNVHDLQVVITSLEVISIGAISVSVMDNDGLHLCSVDDSDFSAGDNNDSVAAIVAHLFIARIRDTLVQLFESDIVDQLQATLRRIDMADVVRFCSNICQGQTKDNTKGSLPNLPLP